MIKLYFALQGARRAYKRAEAACNRAATSDAVAGLWEALDEVRYGFGLALIDAEVAYLQGRG